MQPCVLFLDECEATMRKRGGGSNAVVDDQAVALLLQLLNKSLLQLRIIACTNIPDEIDEAALRRFSTKVYVGLPDDDSRKALLRQQLLTVSRGVEITDQAFQSLVDRTEGWNNDRICNMVQGAMDTRQSRTNEAARAARAAQAKDPNAEQALVPKLTIVELELPALKGDVPASEQQRDFEQSNEAFARKNMTNRPPPSYFRGVDATPLKDHMPAPDAFRLELVGVSREKGDIVEVLWTNGEWLTATITAVQSSKGIAKTYNVLYKVDGSTEKRVPLDRVRM